MLQPKVEWILFQYPQCTASCCILQRGMTIAISKWPFVGIWYSPFSDAPVCVYNIVYLCIDAQIVMTLYCLFAAAGRRYCCCTVCSYHFIPTFSTFHYCMPCGPGLHSLDHDTCHLVASGARLGPALDLLWTRLELRGSLFFHTFPSRNILMHQAIRQAGWKEDKL